VVVEVSEPFLQQFVDGLKESAAAQKESAAAQQASAAAVGAVAVELRALADETRKGRESAVSEIKVHLDTQFRLANRWPTILLGVLTAIATVAVGVLGLIAARPHGGP
jgi:hypothetical protein